MTKFDEDFVREKLNPLISDLAKDIDINVWDNLIHVEMLLLSDDCYKIENYIVELLKMRGWIDDRE